MFFISIVVNTGMWFERFVIVVTSLYRDFLPSSWGTYRATKWDYMTFVGTLGLFTTLFLLFVRFLPMIPMNEIRMILPAAKIKPKTTASPPLHPLVAFCCSFVRIIGEESGSTSDCLMVTGKTR